MNGEIYAHLFYDAIPPVGYSDHFYPLKLGVSIKRYKISVRHGVANDLPLRLGGSCSSTIPTLFAYSQL
jgi:hypothetical protein